ncbi:Ribosomal lysine N-methyltransferase 4 [Psilocybe cubensis]|uniref:Ribosomal lysine N-methyltransferase 4 n=2 Tax=Psilocybe cubensis TaxID=181762 RepID=A0ACB8HD09_PSICU|nr:Ribosomal lysine N-methyltransferase 4 [Psilocybe cubensis]KAH9485074.1 Ribosomal lysine N-methyltransferase 4 [Psilocybe cubensis]
MPSPEMQAFFSWFQSNDGYIDTAAMDVMDFPASEGGRGAIALVDIPENHTVFSIPRKLLLTPRTSALPAKMGERAWKKTFELHRGWAGLILCMMWEAAQGAQSKWCSYFEMMPTTFDTPMFWSEDELAELKGTSVVDKLGKDDAEKTYAEKVLPAIQSRPDLFAQEDIPTLYSLDVFHMMGTRIQSRSFTVEKDESELADAGQDQDVGNASMGSAMDVDEPEATGHEHEDGAVDEHNEDDDEGEDEDGDEADEDDNTEIAMVPLADILNARYKSENVRLFYEPECLKMVSTRVIKAGEQIWNTYGDPPNAELLRAYGHVDWLPLPFTSKSESGNAQEQEYGNPGDVLEIRADLVVQCVLDELNANANVGGGNSPMTMDDMEPRIDWWMEDVGEDVFVLEHPLADTDASQSSTADPKQRLVQTLTPSLLAFIRLLSLPAADFARAQQKDKMPKPGADARALRVARAVLVRRAGMYVGGGVLEDKAALGALDAVPVSVGDVGKRRRRHAIMVRLGEKRVLEALLGVVDEAAGWVEKEEGAGAKDEKKNKRKAAKDEDAEGGRKKRR